MGDREADKGTIVERWWVCFEDATHRGWWRLWTSKGFGHVWAFRMLGEHTFVINPHLHRIETEIAPYRAAQVVEEMKSKGLRVLVYARAISVYDAGRDRYIGRGFVVNCATVLAYLMGVRFSWCCTPRALYRALLREGAEEV
jgi:hypothetical protein